MTDIKNIFVPAVLAAVVLTAAAPVQAQTYTYSRSYVVEDNMPIRDARRIALRVHPGTVTEQRLVRGEYGQDIYVFHIANHGGRYAVAVDAETGAVIDNVRVTPRVYRNNFWDRLFAPTHIGP